MANESEILNNWFAQGWGKFQRQTSRQSAPKTARRRNEIDFRCCCSWLFDLLAFNLSSVFTHLHSPCCAHCHFEWLRSDVCCQPFYFVTSGFSGLRHYVKMLKRFLLSNFSYPYTLHTNTEARARQEIVERTQQTNRRKKLFPCCAEHDGIPGPERYRKTGGKTYANSEKLFSAFLRFIVYCLLSCRGRSRVSQNEMGWWQCEKGWWWHIKSIISHCLIVLLLISLPFINYYRLRSSTADVEVQINFIFR